MVQHLSLAVVQERVARRLRDVSLRRHHDPHGQVHVAGVLNIAPDGLDGDLIELLIEIPTDGNEGTRVHIEELIDEDPGLQRLADALHAGDEYAFSPTRGRLPGPFAQFVSLNVGGPAALEVQVDHIHHHVVGQLHLGMQNGPLPGDLSGFALLRLGSDFLIARRGRILVQVLVVLHDLVAAEDDEVVVLEDLTCGRIYCRDPLVALVWSAFQQAVHGVQAHFAASIMLAADLLKAEDVRIESNKLRPQDWYAILKARHSVGPVVQVHEIEGGNVQLDEHLVSPTSYGLIVLF